MQITHHRHCLPKDISVEQFLAEYWQKKPLLIKQGLPQLIAMFEPEDMLGLALEEDVAARLITQSAISQSSNLADADKPQHSHPFEWSVKKSPLQSSDFTNLPEQWTVLIQNLEQWSPELGELWQAFDFIPQWQRDDIMVSYAPKGGSVGKHYDDYDVFLAQGYGHRRWQLGKYCDETTEFVPDQPIRIFDDMGEIIFDEILEPGDVLYVPPKLSHYGVAQDDCLTFSFGFRRPNLMQVLDSLTDVATCDSSLFVPLLLAQTQQPSGLLADTSIQDIKQQLLNMLNSSQGDKLITQAISEVVSKRQYEIMLADDQWSIEDLEHALQHGANVVADANSRLLYTFSKDDDNHETVNAHQNNEKTAIIYANGQRLDDITEIEARLLQRLADGETLNYDDFLLDGSFLLDSSTDKNTTDASMTLYKQLLSWLENGWVWIDAASDEIDESY